MSANAQAHAPAPAPVKAPPSLGIAALVVLLLAGLVLLPRLFGHRDPPMVGKDAPDFSLPVLAASSGDDAASLVDGATLKLSALRGKPVVLDFWASWCGPCQAEAPILSHFAERSRDRVTVIGVNTSDDPAHARAFAARKHLKFPVVSDEEGATARSFGVDGLPTLIVVSGEGKIVGIRTGVTEEAEIERLVASAR